MRALLLLMLALNLSTPSFAGSGQASTQCQDRHPLASMTRDLNSQSDSVRYRAARRFYAGVRGFKEQNPTGLNQGDAQHEDLRNLVVALYGAALYDHTDIRVYAIKSLRQVVELRLLPDPADHRLVLSIWLDILRIAEDPNEPKPVRLAASGSL